MEIYKDYQSQKAIIICDADELERLENGQFFSAEHWRKLAEAETENWRRDLDFEIALKHAEMHDELASARIQMIKLA